MAPYVAYIILSILVMAAILKFTNRRVFVISAYFILVMPSSFFLAKYIYVEYLLGSSAIVRIAVELLLTILFILISLAVSKALSLVFRSRKSKA